MKRENKEFADKKLKSDLRGIETCSMNIYNLSNSELKSDLRGIETKAGWTPEQVASLLKSDLRGIETCHCRLYRMHHFAVKIRP